MSPKIHTPVKGFNGTVAGVDFKNGVGETVNPSALTYFGRQGYTILPDDPKEADKPKEPTEREKLIAEAKELGLDVKGKNDEIKARIAEHKAKQAAPQTPPAGDESKGSDGDGKTPSDGDSDKGKEQK